MIEVKVLHDGDEIARMKFVKIRQSPGLVDYRVQIGVERLGSESAIGMHTIEVKDYNRTKYNVLALVYSALDLLEHRDLLLESDTTEEHFKRRKISWRSVLGRTR